MKKAVIVLQVEGITEKDPYALAFHLAFRLKRDPFIQSAFLYPKVEVRDVFALKEVEVYEEG